MRLFRGKKGKRKQSLSEREKRLFKKERAVRLSELRLLEAAQLKKDFVQPTGPNSRGYWDQRPLRNQARHLYQNDATARRGVDSYVSNMIGAGVFPTIRSEKDEGNALVAKRFFRKFSETTQFDHDGDNTLVGIQGLVARTLIIDGSVFVVNRSWSKRFKVQVLEADYLDVTKNSVNKTSGRAIVNGIEFNKYGQIVAYHLYDFHPEDPINVHGGGVEVSGPMSISVNKGESRRVPASRVLHIKRIDRPGQIDGISWLAPVMIKLWDLREYEDARLKQAKLQATITAFIKDNAALDAEDREDLLGEDGGTDLGGNSTREIEPGHIEELPIGKDVVFPQPSNATNENFIERGLRYVSSGLGVSYEIYNDYSNVSYSSGRMGFQEMDRNLKHTLKTVIEPQFLLPLGQWVLDHLVYAGLLGVDHDVRIKWIAPAREMIDPGAEGQALSNLVANNLISMRQAHAQLGYEFESQIEDIVYSNETMQAAGLSPLVSFAGAPATADAIPGTAAANEAKEADEEKDDDKEE